jgi:hypothetical protein
MTRPQDMKTPRRWLGRGPDKIRQDPSESGGRGIRKENDLGNVPNPGEYKDLEDLNSLEEDGQSPASPGWDWRLSKTFVQVENTEAVKIGQILKPSTLIEEPAISQDRGQSWQPSQEPRPSMRDILCLRWRMAAAAA